MGLMNKKGMFFTILTIVIISLFILGYVIFSEYQKSSTTEQRIETLNSFIGSVEKDIPRQLYVAGYRFIFVTEKNILERGQFASNLNRSFQEAFFNGTIDGDPSSVLVGATFSDIENSIENYAKNINANITLSNPVIQIDQVDPWHVQVMMTLNMQITDENKLASWNKTKTFSTKIPIENFDDPVYIIKTNGKVAPKIVETDKRPFVTGTDVSNLNTHSVQMKYISSSEAPSFLNRLEGNLSASQQGVESLVNLAALSAQGIAVQQKSVVDHIYFSSDNPSSCTVKPSGLPAWFRLDSAHLASYNVSCA